MSKEPFYPPNLSLVFSQSKPPKKALLFLLPMFALTLSFTSLFVFSPQAVSEGALSRWVGAVTEELEKSEAVSVFLGWDEKSAEDDTIKTLAEEYIANCEKP